MIFTLHLIAMLGSIGLCPPEQRYSTKDLCKAALVEQVHNLQAKKADVLSATCDLQQLAPMK